MTRQRTIQTHFSAGVLGDSLRGRVDLVRYRQSVARLENMRVLPGGGVTTRPGMSHLAALSGKTRLIADETPDFGAVLYAFSDASVTLFINGIQTGTVATIWAEAEIDTLDATSFSNGLLLCHPDFPPKHLRILPDQSLVLDEWSYDETNGVTRYPLYRFDREIALQSSAVTGTVTVTASASLFTADHLGTTFRIGSGHVLLTNIQTATQAIGTVQKDLADTDATRDWAEQAFSIVRGFPTTSCFHQGRLVIGGSRDLPDHVWMSKAGQPFNFDSGTALDDEAIDFNLEGEQTRKITSLISGQALAILTTRGIYSASGAPITPSTIWITRQSHVGAFDQASTFPLQINGSIHFIGQSGQELFDFVPTDIADSWRVESVSLLTPEFIDAPRSHAWWPEMSMYLLAKADGEVVAATLDQQTDTIAFYRFATEGSVRSIAVSGDIPYFVTERGGSVRLERFDTQVASDAAVTILSGSATQTFAGLDHLEGQNVIAISDGARIGSGTVSGGAITLPVAVTSATIGLPFTMVLEALPATTRVSGGFTKTARPVRIHLLCRQTMRLTLNTGLGLKTYDVTSDELVIRSLGWNRRADDSPWSFQQDADEPCTILSVSLENWIND